MTDQADPQALCSEACCVHTARPVSGQPQALRLNGRARACSLPWQLPALPRHGPWLSRQRSKPGASSATGPIKRSDSSSMVPGRRMGSGKGNASCVPGSVCWTPSMARASGCRQILGRRGPGWQDACATGCLRAPGWWRGNQVSGPTCSEPPTRSHWKTREIQGQGEKMLILGNLAPQHSHCQSGESLGKEAGGSLVGLCQAEEGMWGRRAAGPGSLAPACHPVTQPSGLDTCSLQQQVQLLPEMLCPGQSPKPCDAQARDQRRASAPLYPLSGAWALGVQTCQAEGWAALVEQVVPTWQLPLGTLPGAGTPTSPPEPRDNRLSTPTVAISQQPWAGPGDWAPDLPGWCKATG